MPRNRMNLVIAMAAGALFIVTVLPINAFDDSLLLYLPFDENAGGIARDLTGKTGGGKIIGGTKIVQGRRGRALQLDGETGYAFHCLKHGLFAPHFWLKALPAPPER